MPTPQVSVAPPNADVQRLAAPIATAFSSDPFVRWLLPDSAAFLRCFPPLVRSHASTALTSGGAYHTSDARASALWFPAGVEPDPAAALAMRQAIPDSRRDSAAAVFKSMSKSHPQELFWHLRLLGVDPPLHGAGYGSALLEASLRDIDGLGLAAFLESTSPGSKRLYERHGFEAMDEIQEGDSPPIWPMLRKAR